MSYEAQAVLAFGQLLTAMDANRPSLMPPAVAAVAGQLGGFQLLQEVPRMEFSIWRRKEFIATYITLVKESPERLAALAGPASEITKALAATLTRLPGREEVRRIESDNRQRLETVISKEDTDGTQTGLPGIDHQRESD